MTLICDGKSPVDYEFTISAHYEAALSPDEFREWVDLLRSLQYALNAQAIEAFFMREGKPVGSVIIPGCRALIVKFTTTIAIRQAELTIRENVSTELTAAVRLDRGWDIVHIVGDIQPHKRVTQRYETKLWPDCLRWEIDIPEQVRQLSDEFDRLMNKCNTAKISLKSITDLIPDP